MLSAEKFFSGQINNRITAANLPVFIHEPYFERHIPPEKTSLACLTTNRIPDFIPALFADRTALEHTLASVRNGASPRYTHLETITSHQSGRNGIIRLFRAVTENSQTTPFVVHISRFPIEDVRSHYLKPEFDNLVYLSELFERHLDDTTRQQYNVVKPIVYGISGEFKGKKYPFFTMPFISQGELHQNWKPYNGLSAAVPFFMYAIPYTEQMGEIINLQTANAVSKDGMDVHQRLSQDLLTANALIYHLTGGRMLKDLKINAGDWMAKIDPDTGMNLTLTSIHDGFTEPVTPIEWMRTMKDHVESCESAMIGIETDDIDIYTFLNWPDSFFHDCLTTAEKLIKK